MNAMALIVYRIDRQKAPFPAADPWPFRPIAALQSCRPKTALATV